MKKRKVRVFIVVSLIISFVLTQTFTSFGDELPNGSYRLIKAYDFEGQDLEVDLGDKECEPWTVREYDKDSDRASKYSKRYLSCEYQNIIGENPEEESFDLG